MGTNVSVHRKIGVLLISKHNFIPQGYMLIFFNLKKVLLQVSDNYRYLKETLIFFIIEEKNSILPFSPKIGKA